MIHGYDRVKLFQLIEKICVHIIIVLSCAVLVTPLIVRTDVLYMYIIGKIFAFRILVELMAGLWIFLCIYKKTYRPKFRDPILASLTVFIFVLILTMFTGVDPYRSFWSYQERMMGVITMLHLWLWLLILTSVLRSWAQWRVLFFTSLVANVLVGLYGVGQKFHLPFLIFEADPLRMASTLGNSIYLGGYALLHVFISLFLFIRSRHNLIKLFCAITFIFNLYMVYASGSRGPFFAATIGLFGFFLSRIWAVRNQRIRTLLRKTILIVIVCALPTLGFLYTSVGKRFSGDYLPPIAQKLLYKTLNDPYRLALWEVGIKGFLARPLTGWGWSNYDYVNNAYIYDTTRVRVTNPWNDQSHNQLIDVLAMTGVFGGVAYCAFWYFLFAGVAKKIWRSHRQPIALIAMFFLLLAYFLQNLTVFDNPATIIVFYFIAAAVFFLVHEKDNVITAPSPAQGQELKREREAHIADTKIPFPRTGYAALPILISVSLVAVFLLNVRHFQASQQGISALRSTERGNVSEGIEKFQKFFTSNSFVVPEFREQFADITSNLSNSGRYTPEQLRPFVELATAESKKNTEEHPLNFRYVLRLLSIMDFSKKFDAHASEQALEIAKKSTEIHKNRYELYRSIAELSFLTGNNQQAIEYAQRALQYDHIKARSHWHLSIQYARAGMVDKALDEAWNGMMDDCSLYSYNSYVRSLADAFPKTDNAHALEFFSTLAAAYGRKDTTFLYAAQRVFSRAEELRQQRVVSSTQSVIQHN